MTKQEYYNQFARNHERWENKGKRLFYKAIRAQIKPVLEYLESSPDISPEQVNSLVQIAPLRDAFIKFYGDTGTDAAKKEYKILRSEEPTKISVEELYNMFVNKKWRRWMENYALINAADLVTKITEHTKEEIRFAIALAHEKGKVGVQMAAEIFKATLGKIGLGRSLTIARTETTRAANEGKRIGTEEWAKDTGTKMYKVWVTRNDGHERHTHREAGKLKPVPFDDKFEVGGVLMTQPGDPTAPAKETVLCRCTHQPMSERRAMRLYGV